MIWILISLCTGKVTSVSSVHLWPHLTHRKPRSVTTPLYADDTQVYGFRRPAAVGELSASISECTAAVASCMRSNRLQLNADKTEVVWCTTGRRQHQLPSGTLTIDGTAVSASSSVLDLGIYIDADLMMQMHVQKTVSRCFAVLRQLHQIRRSVPQPTFQSLVVTLVNSRLDYGNGALIGLPVYLTRRLQSVLNAAARLIFNLRRSDHVSDAPISLHWLRVPERIRSKVAALVYKVLHGCAPSYLDPFTYVADLPSRRGLRSSCSDCRVHSADLTFCFYTLSIVDLAVFSILRPR